jgi:hypothetical protein
MMPLSLESRLRTVALAALLPVAATSGSAPVPCGLSGQTNGTTITYSFAGTLTQPFGSLAVGTPFTGSFSYAAVQPDLSPADPNRGDYKYQSISLTIGGTTVTDNGTGVINVYDGPGGYPTDLFHLYTYNVSGSLGGLTLAPGAGVQVVLQNINGTTWGSTALPDETHTLADFTPDVSATFVELHSPPPAPPGMMTIARGELSSCCSTPPAAAMQALAGTIAAMGLPQGVKNSLTAPLNSTPGCGSIGAFINQVNAKVQNGQLTQAQAAALLLAANSIKTCLSCP